MTTTPAPGQAGPSTSGVITVAEGAGWRVEFVTPEPEAECLPWYQVHLTGEVSPAELAGALSNVTGPDYRMTDFDGEVMFFEAD